jgi:Fe(3+) dicitrate transport protein
MRNLSIGFILLGSVAQVASAQETLETIEVSEEKQGSFSGYWEENKGTQIFSGKKNTITDLKQIPQLQTNNYRQATSQTPGLLISEVPNESLAAITYRGLGDPHESYNVLLLQDGIPVASDMFGYPAHYYSPALPMMDKFQFIRGGAALHYGPQPGGVVNYLSHPLQKGQALSGRVGITAGSYNLLTTNNAVYGSKGDHSYAIEYYRRQGDGPQRINSNFHADYVQIRDHIFKGKNTFKIAFNGYNSDHGETGGFAKKSGTNLNTFGDDLGKTSKRHDRLKVHRAQLSLGVDHKIDDSSVLEAAIWGNAYNRYSKRQKAGSAPTFGGIANGTENTIVDQRYFGYNGQVKYLKNYSAFGNEHTFSAGYLNYNLISPIVQETGSVPDANHGTVDRRTARATHSNSYFAENRFSFGKFMVTPGIRVENIRQNVEERKGGSGRKTEDTDNVPLLGLGLSYHSSDESQFYANVSEAYKPLTWTDAIPTATGETVAEDIEAAKTLNSEIGYRGQTDKLNWDVSLFNIRYENKIALVGTTYRNSGAGTHRGVDAATEFKLSKVFSALKPFGDFNLYANVSVLDARYTRGALKDRTPQYAPKTMTRAGIIYNKEDKLKVALMGVVVGKHYANDNNGNGTTAGSANNFEIPSYTIFDLTADWNVTKSWIVSGGINNLLDKQYFSRVRSDGINWALDRNYYAGVTYKF